MFKNWGNRFLKNSDKLEQICIFFVLLFIRIKQFFNVEIDFIIYL